MSDEEVDKTEFWRRDNPIAYGVGVTCLLILLYGALAFTKTCGFLGCERNFSRFMNSTPNEMGDTLAGLLAALALIWIIVTVFLQSHELREQRKEFAEQRQATEDMARSMAAQARIFESEERQRNEAEASRTVEMLMERAATLIHPIRHNNLTWLVEKKPGVSDSAYYSIITLHETSDAETLVRHFCKIATRTATEVFSRNEAAKILEKPAFYEEYSRLQEVLQQISAQEKSLSASQRIWLEDFAIDEAVIAWHDLISTDELWSNRP